MERVVHSASLPSTSDVIPPRASTNWLVLAVFVAQRKGGAS